MCFNSSCKDLLSLDCHTLFLGLLGSKHDPHFLSFGYISVGHKVIVYQVDGVVCSSQDIVKWNDSWFGTQRHVLLWCSNRTDLAWINPRLWNHDNLVFYSHFRFKLLVITSCFLLFDIKFILRCYNCLMVAIYIYFRVTWTKLRRALNSIHYIIGVWLSRVTGVPLSRRIGCSWSCYHSIWVWIEELVLTTVSFTLGTEKFNVLLFI